MAKFTVVVSDARHDNYDIERRILKEIDAELKICNCVSAADIAKECADADGILLDMAPMNKEAVSGLKKCKVINRYGVGYDNVDVDECSEKGIWVSFVPDYCMEDVSDHALALLLSCLRQTALRDRKVREGQWNIKAGYSARLKGKTLGILGAGRIAKSLMRKVKGFGFEQILVYDPYVPQSDLDELNAKKVDLIDVLKSSDFISLHMPVTEETKGIINKHAISLMKQTAILINTGRGPLIDDAALIEALKNGRIAFAGLDTHCKEPLPIDSGYMTLDNVVLTDHAAYGTVEGVIELKEKSAKNIAAVLCGKIPYYSVNHL